ncbi:MAG: hypothetical protein KDD70_12175 [Bdellovibrionales bacterium]|nr:hypothetical protein [Bdellovibrionales bacterium]
MFQLDTVRPERGIEVHLPSRMSVPDLDETLNVSAHMSVRLEPETQQKHQLSESQSSEQPNPDPPKDTPIWSERLLAVSHATLACGIGTGVALCSLRLGCGERFSGAFGLGALLVAFCHMMSDKEPESSKRSAVMDSPEKPELSLGYRDGFVKTAAPLAVVSLIGFRYPDLAGKAVLFGQLAIGSIAALAYRFALRSEDVGAEDK